MSRESRSAVCSGSASSNCCNSRRMPVSIYKSEKPSFLARLRGASNHKTPKSTIPYQTMKIVLLGNMSVGKSSILQVFGSDTTLDQAYAKPTIGTDIKIRKIEVGGKRIQLNLWDTAGLEKFRSILPLAVREAHAIIFTFDITNPHTMNALPEWLDFANQHGPENAVKIIVGNKTDLEGNRKVSTNAGQAFAEVLGIPFIETSAKTGLHVEALFRTVVASVLQDPVWTQHETEILKLDLESDQEQPRRGCNCN